MTHEESSGELERQLNSVFDDIYAARRSLIKEYELIICDEFPSAIRKAVSHTIGAGIYGVTVAGVGVAVGTVALPIAPVAALVWGVGHFSYSTTEYHLTGAPAVKYGTGVKHSRIEKLANAAQREASAFKTLERLLLTVRQECLSHATSSKLRVLKPVLGLGEPIANAGYDEAVTKLGGPVVSSGMAAFTMHEFILISNQRHIEKPTAKLCEIFVAAKDGLQGQLDSWLRFG
uniref:Uncharacterized protein n=1 Tax=Erythrolobus australicus TaxID=1077150 RepID=A0A7S1TJY6_9RHOD|mmetsp:Transcript_1831/g.4855  ORF Transcript_1831/g.4855 Transcript_1831/m.4855 type:complete len:232 (+) Transcript_1831:125-820(+)|eukprot:CAMPEP_0185829122 /NCGR_PEP_ID=MMETSP1353-20130828/59_1 /TAXON_ID=1077150 /ORGANISM="Erythrolobus australicus, Strain CCMP3124" /LENGTH=231 /DNA_ID=CAMNT_0028526875 /DNA_START=115 /DNA_END=810 /DNA_ORIENTATION=+